MLRGQYTAGLIERRSIADYLSEHGVKVKSTTETFVALKLHVDNWRWAGVPFYLRTGKTLPKRITEITIEFRQPPLPCWRLGILRSGGVYGERW